MSRHGVSNLRAQWATKGEFSDRTMEAMLTWINRHTLKDEAFAGSMALMANVKLSTGRPVANHPHYEDERLRNRTKYIYSYLYGDREITDLKRLLKNELRASYLVIEAHLCMSGPPGKPECAMNQVAHVSFKRTTKRRACQVIVEQSEATKKHFVQVYNLNYIYIFRVV
jgi:hypothetical protein